MINVCTRLSTNVSIKAVFWWWIYSTMYPLVWDLEEPKWLLVLECVACVCCVWHWYYYSATTWNRLDETILLQKSKTTMQTLFYRNWLLSNSILFCNVFPWNTVPCMHCVYCYCDLLFYAVENASVGIFVQSIWLISCDSFWVGMLFSCRPFESLVLCSLLLYITDVTLCHLMDRESSRDFIKEKTRSTNKEVL